MVDFKLILGIVGNAIAISLFASPMPTFWSIYKNKSTQSYSGLPYVCTLGNCMLWVLYGLPMVTENALLVITINVAGCVLEIFYLTLFLIYSPRPERRSVTKVLMACVVVYTLVAVVTLTVVPHKIRKIEVGIMCVVLAVAMYVAPLSVMKLVIRTRSVEFMPLLLSVCVFLNSTVWTGYGIISKDVFIMIPNALGMLSGIAQLSLHAIFRNATPRPLGGGHAEDSQKTGAAGTDSHMQQPIYVPIEKDCKAFQGKNPAKLPSPTSDHLGVGTV